MKQRFLALPTACAVALVSTALAAGPVSTTFEVKSYDRASHVVTGMHRHTMIQARHTAATTHVFVPNPLDVPPGPCREIALRWNEGVFQNRAKSYFDKLLKKSAANKCRLTAAIGAPDANGVADASTMAPAK
jgi:hypothetical protein